MNLKNINKYAKYEPILFFNVIFKCFKSGVLPGSVK